MNKQIIALWMASLVIAGLDSRGDEPSPIRAELVDVRKIWDEAPHNAFTDLVRWRGRFYCAFREGMGHAGDQGRLRVIASDDGRQWQSVMNLRMRQFDLRDAALSVTPEDQLMVLGGAQQDVNGTRATGTFVSLTNDGTNSSPPTLVLPPGRWLWRVTWHGDWAYGVSYAANEGRPYSALHRTRDGLHFETVTPQLLGEGGWPTEAQDSLRGRWNGLLLAPTGRRSGKHRVSGRGFAPLHVVAVARPRRSIRRPQLHPSAHR